MLLTCKNEKKKKKMSVCIYCGRVFLSPPGVNAFRNCSTVAVGRDALATPPVDRAPLGYVNVEPYGRDIRFELTYPMPVVFPVSFVLKLRHDESSFCSIIAPDVLYMVLDYCSSMTYIKKVKIF